MTLGEKQRLFARLAGELITHIYSMGYEVTFGECWRPPETAALYAKEKKGIINSLHCDRLAIDLNLFKDGKFLTTTEDWKAFGEWWEAKIPGTTTWGGRFKDANHFSFMDGGRK